MHIIHIWLFVVQIVNKGAHNNYDIILVIIYLKVKFPLLMPL